MKNIVESEPSREAADGMEVVAMGYSEDAMAASAKAGERPLLVDLTAVGKLRARIGQGGLDELLEILFEDFPQHLFNLYAAAEKHDRKGLRRIAHTMQSSSGTLGLTALADQCRALSEASHRIALAEMRYRVAAIEDAYGRTAAFLLRSCFKKKKWRL